MRVFSGENCLPIVGGWRRGGLVVLSQEATENRIREAGDFVPAMRFGKLDRFINRGVIRDFVEKE